LSDKIEKSLSTRVRDMSPNDIVKECKDEIDEQIEKTIQLM